MAGARPNFMKIKPVLKALEARSVEVCLVHTEQHYDSKMSAVFFEDLDLRPPDKWLGTGSGTHAEQTAAVMVALEPLVNEVAPEAVVVVGDVNSTLACGLVAAKAGCLLAHVEAGLRSRSWSMPEEINRVVVDRISDLLFAPSQDAVDNLHAEGYREDQVHHVGNVMVDTLLSNLDRAKARPILEELGLRSKDFGLATLHRPDNVDDERTLSAILSGIGSIARDFPIIFPAHPRVAEMLTNMSLPPGIRVIEPLGYLDFIALETSARLVLTDSGGVQEETTVLGVPCLTLRDNTERPITVELGTNRVVGRNPDRIAAAGREVLANPRNAQVPPLWDGHAGDRIADVLIATLDDPDRLRPSDLAPPS